MNKELDTSSIATRGTDKNEDSSCIIIVLCSLKALYTLLRKMKKRATLIPVGTRHYFESF